VYRSPADSAALQKISWTVEWAFSCAPGLRTTCRVPEDTPLRRAPQTPRRCCSLCAASSLSVTPTLRDALRLHLAPPPPPGAPRAKPALAAVDAPTRHALRSLLSALSPSADGGETALAADSQPRFFLEKLGVPASQTARWLELAGCETLGKALGGKWLLEFPTLHVACGDQAASLAERLAADARPEAPPAEAAKWL